MKTKLLIAAVMFFSLSVAAFAQTTYTVGSTPVTTVVSSGITEKAGDIAFNVVPYSGNTITGTITINYGIPITFQGYVNISAGGPTVTVVGPPTSGDPNSIVLTILANNAVHDYTFLVTGVRVNVAGDPGAIPLNVQITSVGNLITAGETNPRVINAARPAINSCAVSGLTINDITGAITGTNPVTLTVNEEFRNAFGVTNASDLTQTLPQRIKIWLDQTPPAGITVTFPAADSSGHWTLLSSNATTAYYGLAVDTDTTIVENVYFYLTVAAAAPVHSRYPAVTVYANVSLGTIAAEVYPATPIVRYVVDPRLCPTPVFSTFHPANPTTTMLVPFAVNTVPVMYDTGLAIANTTSDPGFANMGFYGALQQSGTFKIYIYNSDGSVYTVNSSALPSKGILSSGALPTGKVYTILLSEVLNAASAPQAFSGYLFVITQFTNAHGEFFISDFGNFTHGALMLQVNTDRDLGIGEGLDN
jgi:hypothetical protein